MTVPERSAISRRRFGALATSAVASLALGGACHETETQEARSGRIAAQLRSTSTTPARGTRALALDRDRDALLAMPDNVPDGTMPLIVLLHGAGGSGTGILRRFGKFATQAGLAVLAPDSRNGTWDAIRGGFGPDVRFLSRALERVSESVAVDRSRISIGGFSDGATYALSLGVINGDLFQRIVAFSPGFILGGELQGKPRIFVSHGTADRVLPINRCSRVVVPALQNRGYDVTYREFEGGHEVPAAIAAEGMSFAGK